MGEQLLIALIISLAVLQGVYFSWLSRSILRLRKSMHHLRSAMQVIMLHDPDLQRLLQSEDTHAGNSATHPRQ